MLRKFFRNYFYVIFTRKSYLGIYTVYQLIDMQKGWDERPLEEYYTTISRQNVEFPSVTVCPSGKLYGQSNTKKNSIKIEKEFLAKILISIIQLKYNKYPFLY